MTSIPASRSVRAMILAPRSWPSRPGLATTTRIGPLIRARVYPSRDTPGPVADGSCGSSVGLRRCEHDEQAEPLLDRVEAMLLLRGDEEDVAGLDGPLVAARREPGPARDDVVDLVLGVRRRRAARARLEHVEPGAHARDAQELAVELTRP